MHAQVPITSDEQERLRRRLENGNENGYKVLKTVPIARFLNPSTMRSMLYQAHIQTKDEWRHPGLVPIECWQ